MTTDREIIEFVEENDVKFIRLAFVDLFGTMKNIAIMPSELTRALAGGISFDASSVRGFCGVERSDLFLRPDSDTMTLLPWRPQTGRVARMMCDCLTPEGALLDGYSRTILRRQAEKATERGYRFRLGTEYEFYLFETDEHGKPTLIPQDEAGYMDVAPLDKGENVRRDICLTLETMHIPPESSHHESGPGQNEIDFRHAGPVTAADHAMEFRSVVHTIAAQYGLHASFLPKPLAGESGNGLHVNLSVVKDGRNLFRPEGGQLPPEAQHAMAGILRRIREISLFLNPVPSSYERLGVFEAPREISWSSGGRNRLIRIPAAGGDDSRMELRSPDPACNPYLAFSLIIASALEGLEQALLLQAPVVATGELPGSIEEAIDLAEASAFVREVIPEPMLGQYLAEKRRTAERYRADPEAVRLLHWKTI